jgi:hypothetical protein
LIRSAALRDSQPNPIPHCAQRNSNRCGPQPGLITAVIMPQRLHGRDE